MPDPDTISADYTLRPSELAATLKILVEARQPVMVWGGPGCGKSEVAQQVAAEGGRTYCDVRALLLDPVDLRGIPWRDNDNRTRWAPPDFLPPSTSTDLWLVNLEELPSGVPMVQAALFQLVRDRKCGEYEPPRRRLAHGLRQPRERPRRHPPHADAAGVALRPPRDQGRPVGLVRMGEPRTESRPRLCSSSNSGLSFFISSIPSRARRLSPVPGHGSSSQTS